MNEILRRRWVIIVILALLIMSIGIWVDSKNFSSTRYTVNYQNLSSNKIPYSHQGMTMACFGDVEYGTFMNEARLKIVVEKINTLSPDTIIFLGDLYDKGYSPSNDDENTVIKLLQSLEAKEGKFAVLGDFDIPNKEMVVYDLTLAGFEILENDIIQLHHGSNDYIDLIGLTDVVSGIGDINAIYSNIENTRYTLAICHTPDIINSLPLNMNEAVISANSHGSQIYVPMLGAYEKVEGSKQYGAGVHLVSDETTMYVTTGIGTTKKDVRLFSDPEILFFRFQHSD